MTHQASAALLINKVCMFRNECRDFGLHGCAQEFPGTGLDHLGKGIRGNSVGCWNRITLGVVMWHIPFSSRIDGVIPPP